MDLSNLLRTWPTSSGAKNEMDTDTGSLSIPP
jgi:hypothetical protein